jgi:hypothetical protein
MAISTLRLPGCVLQSITREDTGVVLGFSLVYLVKKIEGAFEDTLWKQAGDLIIFNAEIEEGLPACPCEIDGGDLQDNIYTFRDMVPLPLKWRGATSCILRTRGGAGTLEISGDAMEMHLIGDPRYIGHIKRDA